MSSQMLNVQELLERKEFLERKLEECDRKLANAPPGRLHVSCSNGRTQYYYREKPSDKKGAYLADGYPNHKYIAVERRRLQMAVYELKKLNTAIEYIDRLAEGKNPVSNEPASGKEILDEPEMIRCLYLVKGVLRDVLDNKGAVGRQKSEKKSMEDIFPYEVLTGFEYRQDQTISDLISQILELLPEDMDIRIPATRITNWLRSNGYLEKRYMEDIHKETSCPTDKGEELGILAMKAGFRSNEYYRILYNQNAQLFIVENLEKILRGVAARPGSV